MRFWLWVAQGSAAVNAAATNQGKHENRLPLTVIANAESRQHDPHPTHQRSGNRSTIREYLRRAIPGSRGWGDAGPGSSAQIGNACGGVRCALPLYVAGSLVDPVFPVLSGRVQGPRRTPSELYAQPPRGPRSPIALPAVGVRGGEKGADAAWTTSRRSAHAKPVLIAPMVAAMASGGRAGRGQAAAMAVRHPATGRGWRRHRQPTAGATARTSLDKPAAPTAPPRLRPCYRVAIRHPHLLQQTA